MFRSRRKQDSLQGSYADMALGDGRHQRHFDQFSRGEFLRDKMARDDRKPKAALGELDQIPVCAAYELPDGPVIR